MVHAALVSGFLVTGLLLVGGCSTYRVVPPPPPDNPTPVFLLDLGRHAGLVLPHTSKMVRYDYGDWEWYVELNQGAVQGSRALLGPSPAALGRQELDGPATVQAVRNQLEGRIEELFVIESEQARVKDLVHRLEAVYEDNLDTLQTNPSSPLKFVRHPESYTLRHNSSSVVAGWLEELGCTVSCGGLSSRWEVQERSKGKARSPKGNKEQ